MIILSVEMREEACDLLVLNQVM